MSEREHIMIPEIKTDKTTRIS